jgi:hypothetical protein
MIDTHLIYLTLACTGIAAGAAILIAGAIIVIEAIRRHQVTLHRRQIETVREVLRAGRIEGRRLREPSLR